ncbi:hypothetical protein JMJ35_004698 [Cladonia borealis]|uniref:Uncharacterized protein n=1 Tax=Cladonia borealis TaxID=184061 RepID=A0AA39UAQ9_9LECA|nr:hypothetical protein JMJ35_004698 [Cladonia borealis]
MPSDATAHGSKSMVGLNLISNFIRGNIQTSGLLGIKSGFSGIRNDVDDTSVALDETSAPTNDSSDITLIDSAEEDLVDQQVLNNTHDVGIQTNRIEDLVDQQVLDETRDVGTQTNRIAHLTAMESELQPKLNRQGETDDTHVTRPEDNNDHQRDYLALTCYRPGQHNDLDLENLTIEQARRDVAPEYDIDMLQAVNEENIRLKLQRDDLLAQRAALEDDLSSSFVEKFNLDNELSGAKETIEKGRAYCERIEGEWKRDIAKLQDMTRLVEANTENAKFVEFLRQQKVLEEANTWLTGEVQMRMEDNRFLACQRKAALDASKFQRYCQMSSEIQMLRRWLSTVQAQLAETGKAKTRLDRELQQERLKHQQVRNAPNQKPQKPSKFTPTYPPGLQTRLPSAGASPQSSSEWKSESTLGRDTFFETCAPSGSIPRSKSKFTFGDNAVSPSASISTGTTPGATTRTDLNFTFGGTVDHQSSLGADGNTTKPMGSDQTTSAPSVGNCEMPLVEAEDLQFVVECDHGEDEEIEGYMHDPRLPSGCSSLAGEPPAEVKDDVDLSEGLQAKTTAVNTVGCDSTKAAGLYVNPKAQNGARKPSASDFFDTGSVEAEVEMDSTEALVAEKMTEGDTTEEETPKKKTTEGKVPIVSAGADINALPKAPKNMSKTSRRNFLRKLAKARKRAEEVGEGASGGEEA